MAEDTRATGKERSPNYPSMGLPAAIEAARKLWLAEKRTAVPSEVAVKAIGYGSLSGASRSALASLRQYGLVEVSGGTVAVTDLAVTLAVHDQGSTEWAEAVTIAAGNPDIFREVSKTHSDASDAALNAYLITKRRFSADAAQRFVRAFRDTNALASRAAGGYSQASRVAGSERGDDVARPSMVPSAQHSGSTQVTALQFLLRGGLRADVRIFGGPVEPGHIRQLEGLMKAQREALEET